MPDTAYQQPLDTDARAPHDAATPLARQVGLTPAQLRAAASVLAHVHARPHPLAPPAGGSTGPSPA